MEGTGETTHGGISQEADKRDCVMERPNRQVAKPRIFVTNKTRFLQRVDYSKSLIVKDREW